MHQLSHDADTELFHLIRDQQQEVKRLTAKVDESAAQARADKRELKEAEQRLRSLLEETIADRPLFKPRAPEIVPVSAAAPSPFSPENWINAKVHTLELEDDTVQALHAQSIQFVPQLIEAAANDLPGLDRDQAVDVDGALRLFRHALDPRSAEEFDAAVAKAKAEAAPLSEPEPERCPDCGGFLNLPTPKRKPNAKKACHLLRADGKARAMRVPPEEVRAQRENPPIVTDIEQLLELESDADAAEETNELHDTWYGFSISELRLPESVLNKLTDAQLISLGDVAGLLADDGFRALTDDPQLNFLEAAKVRAAMDLWWLQTQSGDPPWAVTDPDDCPADRDRNLLLIDWLKREGTTEAEPNWDCWSEFEVTLEDGAVVRVVYESRSLSRGGHFSFHGPLTDTGYRSHFMPSGTSTNSHPPIVRYAEDFAREVARETSKKRVKSQRARKTAKPRTMKIPAGEFKAKSETPPELQPAPADLAGRVVHALHTNDAPELEKLLETEGTGVAPVADPDPVSFEPLGIDVGDVVRTNYNTGPYRIVSIKECRSLYCPVCATNHRLPQDEPPVWNMVVRATAGRKDQRESDSYLNQYRRENGRIISVASPCIAKQPGWKKAEDELFLVADPQAGPASLIDDWQSIGVYDLELPDAVSNVMDRNGCRTAGQLAEWLEKAETSGDVGGIGSAYRATAVKHVRKALDRIRRPAEATVSSEPEPTLKQYMVLHGPDGGPYERVCMITIGGDLLTAVAMARHRIDWQVFNFEHPLQIQRDELGAEALRISAGRKWLETPISVASNVEEVRGGFKDRLPDECPTGKPRVYKIIYHQPDGDRTLNHYKATSPKAAVELASRNYPNYQAWRFEAKPTDEEHAAKAAKTKADTQKAVRRLYQDGDFEAQLRVEASPPESEDA